MIKIEPMPGRKIKRGKRFFTFISPEAKRILKDYLARRERHGEKITPESPSFGSVYGTAEGKAGIWKRICQRSPFGSPLTSQAMDKIWQGILEEFGLDQRDKSGKWRELPFHVLRKFFDTQCINANVRPAYKEFWLGHRGGYLEDSYFRANLKDHLAEYGFRVWLYDKRSTDI